MLKRATESIKYRDGVYHEENQYLNLIEDILDTNEEFVGRNGKTLSIYGAAMHFSLENNRIPILTTKKVAWKTCLRELLWFIKGYTSNKKLNDKMVHIWDANSSREFLDSRNLVEREVDDLGPIYGFQWRHFNAEYSNCDADYERKGIDQLIEVINCLKDPAQRTSRRMIISAWNPCQLDEMALPPCHILMQFNVQNNTKLSCSMYQRSNDEACGTPFNIASYSFLTHLLAKHCDLEASEFVYFKGNCHIYDEHVEAIKEQINRVPYEFPTLEILHKRENIDDYVEEDFVLQNYKCHESIKYKMVA
jgi:thymidylate synthase